MLIPVVCFTCGCPVGDLADVFLHMKAERVRKALAERGTVPLQAANDADLQVPCDDIFDALGVANSCCRKCLTTAMIYTDHY